MSENGSPGRARADRPKAKRHKAHSLIDKVYDRANLQRAWRRVRANKGAHGLDRVTIEMFGSDIDTHLREIQRKLKERRFVPQPVRRVYIPKASDPNKLRPLGIPVVADRVVQQAIIQIVDPLFDDTLSDRSFGYRKRRSAHDAMTTMIADIKQGYQIVIDADIKGFFDNLSHDVAMSRIRQRIADGRVLDLFEAFLKAGIHEDGVVTAPEAGTPQGGVVSPWISNLVLDDLDKAIEAKGWRHVRYADDFVVLCKTPEEAEPALRYIKDVVRKLELELHETKTRISSARQGFAFLGFEIRSYRVGIKRKAIERLKDRIRGITARQQGRNIEAVIEDLNPVIRGWARYYGVAEINELCRELQKWIRSRLRSFRFKRKRRTDNWRLRSHRLRKWGLLSLADCRPVRRLSLARGAVSE